MTTNEPAYPAPADLSARTQQPEEVLKLLQERVARHTMGDSTSVPLDTARRLLEGILYCIDLDGRFPSPDMPRDAPLSQRWQAGVKQAKRLAKRAKLLYLDARRQSPPVVNTAFCETLDAIGPFFRAYDADFFAQEMPCSFDYPLCQPVPDALLGAEYLLDYLRRWLAESVFLRAFPAAALRPLYERYYGDYVDLLVNLYLPAAEMAALCALAGKPARLLALDANELTALGRRLARADADAARADLLGAADRALIDLGVGGALPRETLRQTALELLTRLRAANVECNEKNT
ncbi:MAG: hypothetical protein GX417_05610 [Clostridiales bacterium]|nr:hypothetical protein [Clostridiales bacterium]